MRNEKAEIIPFKNSHNYVYQVLLVVVSPTASAIKMERADTVDRIGSDGVPNGIRHHFKKTVLFGYADLLAVGW